MKRPIALAAAALVAGCAPSQVNVSRFDGAGINRAAYDQANAVCKGEMQQAAVHQRTQYQGAAAIAEVVEQHNARHTLWSGCMARHGYRIQAAKP